LAFRHGDIRFVIESAIYESERLFYDFIQEMYRYRIRFKAENNLAFSAMAKMIMNSLYGKFGQLGHVRTQIPNVWGVEYGRETVLLRGDNRPKQITIFDSVAWLEEEKGESYNSFPAIAAAVASYARIRLWDLINKAGKENVFYCDTDSLIVNERGLDNLRSELSNDDLGKLKIVWQSDDVEIFSAKDYRIGNKTIIKGIRQNAIPIEDGKFEQIHFSTFLESIRSNRVDSVIETTVQKVLKRNYDKGLVGKDGVVSPLVFTDF